MSRRLLATFGAVCGLMLGGLIANPAQANVITIYDSNEDPWTADTVLSGGILKDTTPNQNQNNPIQTRTVSLTLPYSIDSPFFNSIVFSQQRASRDAGGRAGNPFDPNDPNGDALGLNFSLSATITNKQGPDVTWMGFTALLSDLSPVNGGGTGAHPAFPHFHYLGPKDDPYLSNPLKFVTGRNGGTSFELGLGEVAPNADLTFSAKIHDIVFKNNPRSFELVLSPIPTPEPSSLALLASGGIVLASYGRRAWKRWL